MQIEKEGNIERKKNFGRDKIETQTVVVPKHT